MEPSKPYPPRRAPQLLALHDLDHAMAPTHWQASTAPELFADRISVIHEGIDTRLICPNPKATVQLRGAGVSFQPGDEVVSFAVRNLEPYRGFHVFMRMLPMLQALRPNCHVVIVGGDGVSYGASPSSGQTWRQVLLQELAGRLDLQNPSLSNTPPVLHNPFQVTAYRVSLHLSLRTQLELAEARAVEQ